jgi:hypothetical protein
LRSCQELHRRDNNYLLIFQPWFIVYYYALDCKFWLKRKMGLFI